MSPSRNLNLDFQKKAAKRLLRSLKESQAEALAEVAQHHPKYGERGPDDLLGEGFSLQRCAIDRRTAARFLQLARDGRVHRARR